MSSVELEPLLLYERRHKRRRGEVPYPLRHSSDLALLENWNTLFLQRCWKGPTLYPFKAAPAVVLDLGCGSGSWVMEAANQWPTSTIVGFDSEEIQPDLYVIDCHKDIARRVKWVHGNFLEGLPFSSELFDLVRIACLGLAVPEDEWQYLLEEVSRVMKRGGIVEIIEEDLIFPCAPYTRPRQRPPPISVDFRQSDSSPSSAISVRSRSSSTLPIADNWPNSAATDAYEPSLKKRPSLSPLAEVPPPLPPPQARASMWPSLRSTLSFESDDGTDSGHEFHPQDHSRLKAAWDSMLTNRFLTPNIINVLPFYLSSCFVDVQSHNPLQIPLPSNSTHSALRLSEERSSWFDPEHQFDLTPYSGRKSNETADSTHDRQSFPSASMHLAKTVKTIVACKEALWEEYRKLYSTELPPVTRTSRPNEALSQSSESSAREGFDRAWSNWENDMTDRIGLRDCIGLELHWTEPDGDRPEWRIWRDNTDMMRKKDPLVSNDLSPPLCRSLRGFVACKAR
ncbi:hypothetical protein C8J56DRAFT_930700 [Mycena floridula]|nr:hypothetical protein C8J56DRAFT_930700 [Mycena floridula]